ncbi:MAG: YiiX/YebB-like N1pC/P60 family cysteine hydrolase [Pseudomonas sp.]
MSSIQLMFSTTNKPFSALIRAATWSRWSHVALVSGSHVIEASALGGVRQVSKDHAISQTAEFCLVDLPARAPDSIIDMARSQLGKPYDWSGILGLGLHRNWQEDDAWFCSELVAWAAAESGEMWFRPDAMRRITPQHLWMLPPLQEQFVAAI